MTADAIRHALAAGDFERAAVLAELAWPAWRGSYQSLQWLSWLKDLPDEIVRSRPVLSMGFAYALLNAGDLEAADARLQDVERWLETADDAEAPAAEMIIVDKEQFFKICIQEFGERETVREPFQLFSTEGFRCYAN